MCLVPAYYYCLISGRLQVSHANKTATQYRQTDMPEGSLKVMGRSIMKENLECSATQTEKRCCEQSLPSNLFPFTHIQLITARKPRRCARSFCPSANAESNTARTPPLWPNPPPKTKNTAALLCLKWFFQWFCPCASICFPPSMQPYFGTVRMCVDFRVCVHACLYRRQGHPSQTVPSASNSLVYLSLDQRAAAACPQVSKQPALRTSWEEQEDKGGSASVFIRG